MQEEKEKAAVLHRSLLLKVEGEPCGTGSWQHLMKLALRYGDKNWEIVEKVSGIGERIITQHFSLLQNHGVNRK